MADYILGYYKGSTDAKGLLGVKLGLRAKGVGGSGTGWKLAEVGRARVTGTGSTRASLWANAGVRPKIPLTGPVSGRKRLTSAGPPVWTVGSDRPEYSLSQVGSPGS